jgi:hypothetical protein
MGIGVLAIVAILLLCAVPLHVTAASPVSVTVGTNLTAYSQGGAVSIIVTGLVVPPPSSGTNIVVSIANPTGVEVELAAIPVSNVSGIFSTTFVAGGNANWVNGTYTVTASYATSASGPVYTGTSTFTYGFVPPTTTTTSTTKTTNSSASVTTIINNYTTTKITTISQITTIATTQVNNVFQTTSVVTTITQPGTTVITTVNQAGSTVVTTITQATTLVTTLPGATTTVNQAGATMTVSQITTVQQNNTTGLAVGVVAIIIAIIAGIVAVLAMRRK